MGDLPLAGDANPSEADDEDGWAKSDNDETDWSADHATAFPTLAKRRSSHSQSGWGRSLG